MRAGHLRQASAPAGGASRGFTLVELLVALTLLGLISVVLLGGLRFGTRAWEAGDVRAEALAETEAIQGLLRRTIERAMIPRLAAGAAEGPEFFLGEEDRLRLVTVVPGHIGIGGLYWIELALVGEDADGLRLDLIWRLYRPRETASLEDMAEEEETPIGGRRTLVEGIEQAAFAYYGGQDGTGHLEWRDRWEATAGLPNLVALEMRFPAGSGRSWPALVVHPRTAGAAVLP